MLVQSLFHDFFLFDVITIIISITIILLYSTPILLESVWDENVDNYLCVSSFKGSFFFIGHFRTLKSLDIQKSVWKFRVFKFFLVNRKGSYSTQSTSSEISYQKTSFRFIYAFKTMHISNYVFQKYIKVLFFFQNPKVKTYVQSACILFMRQI